MTIPSAMHGVVLTGHGGYETLCYRDDLPVPTPGTGQILVRVSAAGINNTDVNTRVGWYSRGDGAAEADGEMAQGGWSGALQFPRIQGADLCGRVVAAGDGPGGNGAGIHLIGKRVTCPTNLPRPTADNPLGMIALGSEIDGAFAQYCLLDAADAYDVDRSPLSDVEIAALPCAFGTAENLLERAGVTAGQKVLITGASGGVGMAVVQLAVLRGASVTGVAAAAKAETVRKAGAGLVLSRDDMPPTAQFDVVIDVVAGGAWPLLIRALRPGGHYAVAGAIGGPIVRADMRDIYLNDLTLHGCTYQSRQVFAQLVKLINRGDVRPHVAKTFPLSNIVAAQKEFVSKRHVGKLVLIPEGADR